MPTKATAVIAALLQYDPDLIASIWKGGTTAINVASDKTILGVGNKGIIKGKGLRFVNIQNIIVQNIRKSGYQYEITGFLLIIDNLDVTNLNPQYIWGGDAFTFSGTSKIWVDYCTVRSSFSLPESSLTSSDVSSWPSALRFQSRQEHWHYTLQ